MKNFKVKFQSGGETVTVTRQARSACAAIIEVCQSFGVPPRGIVAWLAL